MKFGFRQNVLGLWDIKCFKSEIKNVMIVLKEVISNLGVWMTFKCVRVGLPESTSFYACPDGL